MICVARGSEQAPDDRAQSCRGFCAFSSLAAWPGRMNPPVIAHCVSKPPPSPSSSPPTPRAENLGKAFPQTSFNLGLHTFRVEINPWKSWGKKGVKHSIPSGYSFFFLQTAEKVHFSAPLPIPSLPLLLSSLFPLPRPWSRNAECCPCLPPPPCASPEHPLPEVMEICGAGAVLVLADAGSQDGSWGHLLITRCWSVVGFGTIWSVMG